MDEMPDEQICAGKGKRSSAHELIKAHIADMEKKLVLFMDNAGAAYFPYESRWSKLPSWVPDTWYAEHGRWNTLTMPVPFTSFEKCVDYLKAEERILETGWWFDNPHGEVRYDRHKVCRVEMDEGWYCSYGHINDPDGQSAPLDYVELDEDFEVTDIAWGWDREAIDRIAHPVPIPFQPGDIVIDQTSRVPRENSNTRGRDFYDIHTLLAPKSSEIDKRSLHEAVVAAASKRGSLQTKSTVTTDTLG